jgi:hypothetical protein
MFWTIFWPVFAALVGAFTISEGLQICIGFYAHKKNEKLRKEFEEKVASGEIDPMQMMFGGGGGVPGMVDLPPGFPTASGNGEAKSELSHGQYL